MYVLLPIPYGLANGKLSAASVKALERALNFWKKSFSGVRPRIHLVLASFDSDFQEELELKKELIAHCGAVQLIELGFFKNEEELARRLARELKTRFGSIRSLFVFTESVHALAVRPIFKQHIGPEAEFRKFKCSFESNHGWISTAALPVWFLRNLFVSSWFRLKAGLKRSFRKKL